MTSSRLVFAGIAVTLIFSACSGSSDSEEKATTTTSVDAPTATQQVAESPMPPPTEDSPSSPQSTSFSYCLLDAEEVDEMLNEFVSGLPGGNLNCTYQTDSGRYLRFEPGSPEDLQSAAELAGVEGESVPGIGDEAVWFAGVEAISHHFDFDDTVSLGVLTVRAGSVHFRTILNTPELEGDAQLLLATEVATVAISRLPGEEP